MFDALGVQKPQLADSDHPLVRATLLLDSHLCILVFSVGGGMSVYEGITHLSHPTLPGNPAWSYAVLGLAFAFEGTTWFFGWKAFSAEKGSKGVLETIHDTKDPTSFSVLLEDSAALLDFFAFLGISSADNGALILRRGIIIIVILCMVSVLMSTRARVAIVGLAVTMKLFGAVVEATPRSSGFHTSPWYPARTKAAQIEHASKHNLRPRGEKQSHVEGSNSDETPDVTALLWRGSIHGDDHPHALNTETGHYFLQILYLRAVLVLACAHPLTLAQALPEQRRYYSKKYMRSDERVSDCYR